MTAQPPRDTRIAFAETLTEFSGQRDWYNQRASSFKARAQRIDVLIIAAGAFVAALPSLRSSPGDWIDYVLIALGITIVVAQGMQRVYRYSEIWPEYRLASERMKREWRLFINAAEHYDAPDEVAQPLYVSRLEGIMADEQKIFFETQRTNQAKQ